MAGKTGSLAFTIHEKLTVLEVSTSELSATTSAGGTRVGAPHNSRASSNVSAFAFAFAFAFSFTANRPASSVRVSAFAYRIRESQICQASNTVRVGLAQLFYASPSRCQQINQAYYDSGQILATARFCSRRLVPI